MPDISMCIANECPIKEFCYRYTAEADPDQTIMMTPPFKEEDEVIICPQFWFNYVEHIESKEMLDAVNAIIEKNEGVGYRAGGSGHLSHVSHKVTLVKNLQVSTHQLLLYAYKLIIDSEFGGTEYERVDIAKVNNNYEVLLEKHLVNKYTKYRDDFGLE